ncbi:hypothetical protein GCM10010965_07620 [Caldalkalibacillus thermarum]|uniref:extracellular solute-binding protein n=1 Tax=Caldalkalibacillus thermarum TaxID=296745 RepID=UPI0019833C75|nr:hypothetical protein GCM10010965_07620 [Caldalkalibacillus thermarum]
MVGTSEAPALVQVFEVGTKYMIESGYIEPMQTFIDRDNFDVSQFEENILAYYQVDGFSVISHGWFTEQMIANQGGLYVDNDNGRSGEPTQALINQEEGQRWFQWLADLREDGTLGNYGRDWDDHRAAFLAQTVAMYLDSTASTSGNVNNADFEVGTAFLPVPDGVEPHGVVVGGVSLWMMADIPEEVQEAAWEFIKYAAQPDVQAQWAASTGYFPITKAAHNESVLQEVYEQYPQFLTAVEQLQNTKLTPATQGALIGVFPEARERVVNAIESVHNGDDPLEALNRANEEINRELENYRRANQ